jgi:hypothetical protein
MQAGARGWNVLPRGHVLSKDGLRLVGDGGRVPASAMAEPGAHKSRAAIAIRPQEKSMDELRQLHICGLLSIGNGFDEKMRRR